MLMGNDRYKTDGRKEGNVLFNNALNTFYLQLYGIRHMVKDHSDTERGTTELRKNNDAIQGIK